MNSKEIRETAAHLKKGEVVIFPTETVFGIGCLISKTEAIKRVYKIKGRDPNQPTHVLVADLAMAESLGNLDNPISQTIIKNFWPGPLTLVVPAKNPKANSLIISQDNMIGLRFPKDPSLKKLISLAGCAILGPSANRAGEKPPVTRIQIDKSISSLVDYIVGQASKGLLPSTLVKVNANSYEILREGPVTKEMIRQAFVGG